MTRARDTNRFFQFWLKNKDIKIEVQSLISTFVLLAYILHCTGCFWNWAAEGNIFTWTNWVRVNEIEDASMMVQYITSLYWATVTCTTVGYGDILPTNNYELLWAMIIIVLGVAFFSYILSDLASKFSDLSKSNEQNAERINKINELDEKFKIGPELVDQLTGYFSNYNVDNDFEANQEMAVLLKILPSSLKTKLSKFLFQDAILINTFFQNRDEDFYGKFLEELEAVRFSQGE